MSQAKVDRYKEEKKNRRKTIQKTKRQKTMAKIIVSAIVIAIVAWIAYSGVTFYQEHKPLTELSVDMSAIIDYLGGL